MESKWLLAACLMAGFAVTPGIFGQTAAPEPQPAPGPSERRVFVHRAGGSYLGIGVAEIDDDRAKALKLEEARGVEVKSVDEDSPAAKAGLKTGDVVLEYNGQPVEGTEQFVRMVHETPAGRHVKLVVWRGGANQTLAATIGTRSRDAWVMDSGDGSFAFRMPPMPPLPAMPSMPAAPAMPPMPDIPRSMLSWRSGMLGIESESLSPQLASYFGVKEGVLVRSVIKDSVAEKAGIRAGDVIVKVDGTPVASPTEITSALRAARRKQTFPVTVMRDKKELTLPVTMQADNGYRSNVRAAMRFS